MGRRLDAAPSMIKRACGTGAPSGRLAAVMGEAMARETGLLAGRPRGLARAGAFMLVLALAACASGPRLESPSHFGTATHLSCVPYARQVSGVQLSGDAYEWWDEADGVYPRAHRPSLGAVLVLKPHGAMDVGHLAVVTALQSRREVLVTQSNWLPGRIEHDQPVVDVSPENDWSLVRVWYEPAHALGRTRYPAYGFILPN